MNRTEMNRKARKMIADYCEGINLNSCENCGGTFGLAPAHRHKRIHYKTAEELADTNEWIALCQFCHSRIEASRQLTEKMFAKLRP